ncbi:LpqB family beta-propeller domain-containing protein [Actinoplanes subtropicus]|uniref:LpqB family beta-propeller domain-containing protein n=1 Tax=Actinoplanes subtropicus TaxID=543632 RepID=UPI0004C3D40B|nr:LpqB family beta-propeller domain-containing protein [Actinoplanes subtropicus]
MRRLLAVAALAALLLSGCGIPDDTRVTVVGAGPSGGAGPREDQIQSVPNPREAASDPRQLLTYFLEAAAGDPDHAAERVKAFLAPSARAGFEAAGPEIRVIRLKGDPVYRPSNQQFTFYAQTVGTLKSNGSLEPAAADPNGSAQYSVEVGPVAGQSGYFVLRPPPHRVLLLSDTALNDFYQRRTIYFWNNENTALIPDLRYMPGSIPSAQQPTTILNWLVTGPASWLGDVAKPLPNNTQAPENVPAVTNDTLSVTLTPQAAPAGDTKALDRLRRQLQWSLLRPDQGPQTLELKIKGQDPVRYSGQDYLVSNPADRLVETPQRFAIFNGVVHRVKSPQAGDPVPALRPEDNKNIASAALSTSATHTFVAVVTAGKNGKLRVGSAAAGAQATLHDVGLSGTLGRPVWAIAADGGPQGAVGLITVNGKLYSFAPDGSAAVQVDWQGEPGAITAVSVAPDGCRMAVVAGGRLYRATLDTSGDTVALSTPERLFPPLFSQVTAVAWSSETYLAVAGASADGQRYAVVDVSVDGALSYVRLADVGGEAVTYLTAYPANPTSHRENADAESYETAGAAWYVTSVPAKIPASDLVGVPANPPPGQTPTAPFFLF